MREPWIKCYDMPLSLFEMAGGIFRANQFDERSSSLNLSVNGGSGETRAKADTFNRQVMSIHMQAVE